MKRKSALLAGAVALALGGVAQAHVFGTGPGGPIPDGTGTLPNTIPGTLTSTIAVPAGSVISVNNVSITMGTGLGATGAHTWVGDLVATLTSPGGDNVHLFARTGTTTSTDIMGSSKTGPALRAASLKAIEPAILNAISEESTS